MSTAQVRVVFRRVRDVQKATSLLSTFLVQRRMFVWTMSRTFYHILGVLNLNIASSFQANAEQRALCERMWPKRPRCTISKRGWLLGTAVARASDDITIPRGVDPTASTMEG